MPYKREAEGVLAKWREVERALADVAPDLPEAHRLMAESTRLRDEYQRLVAEAIANQRPVPPPFPAARPRG